MFCFMSFFRLADCIWMQSKLVSFSHQTFSLKVFATFITNSSRKCFLKLSNNCMINIHYQKSKVLPVDINENGIKNDDQYILFFVFVLWKWQRYQSNSKFFNFFFFFTYWRGGKKIKKNVNFSHFWLSFQGCYVHYFDLFFVLFLASLKSENDFVYS